MSTLLYPAKITDCPTATHSMCGIWRHTQYCLAANTTLPCQTLLTANTTLLCRRHLQCAGHILRRHALEPCRQGIAQPRHYAAARPSRRRRRCRVCEHGCSRCRVRRIVRHAIALSDCRCSTLTEAVPPIGAGRRRGIGGRWRAARANMALGGGSGRDGVDEP